MSDLISRSDVLKLPRYNFGTSVSMLTLEEYIKVSDIKKILTAYSVDKIVEELNKLDVKAIKRYKGGTFGDYEGTDYYIKKSEAIEIVKQGGVSDDISREAKQGKWILDEFTAKYGNPYRCSCCNIEFGDTYNYCPNCGASMKEANRW